MASREVGQLDIVLESANAEDLSGIVALLNDSQLPTTDVGQHIDGFVLARANEQLVGTIAIERYGDVALLRSVCVAASHRNHRVGRLLLEAIESDASTHGIRALYLLTTSASDYFARQGYVTIARDQTPPPIQQTAEFQSLCPASAVCMRKFLRHEVS